MHDGTDSVSDSDIVHTEDDFLPPMSPITVAMQDYAEFLDMIDNLSVLLLEFLSTPLGSAELLAKLSDPSFKQSFTDFDLCLVSTDGIPYDLESQIDILLAYFGTAEGAAEFKLRFDNDDDFRNHVYSFSCFSLDENEEDDSSSQLTGASIQVITPYRDAQLIRTASDLDSSTDYSSDAAELDSTNSSWYKPIAAPKLRDKS